MVRETIQILSNNKVTSRDGSKTYTKIETPRGNYSVWDDAISKKLLVGKAYDVDVNVKGNFKTVRAVFNEVDYNSVKAPTVPPQRAFTTAKQDQEIDRNASVLTSYTKDVFNHIIDKLDKGDLTTKQLELYMALSIDLVQKAYKAFR